MENNIKIEVAKSKEKKISVKSVVKAACVVGFMALGGYTTYQCGKLKQWKIDNEKINSLVEGNEALKIFNDSYNQVLKNKGEA